MNKVLFIVNDFPPPIKGGNMRAYKFVKFLNRSGIQVFVVCNHRDVLTSITNCPDLINDLNGVTFISVPAWLRKDINILPNEPSTKTRIQKDLLGFIKLLFNKYLLPDLYYYTWNHAAYKKAKEIIEEYKIENIITSSPPHSTHFIGKKLKRYFKNKVNWVADFRDFWSLSHDYSNRNKLVNYCLTKAEESVLSHANYVIFVSKGILNATLSKFQINGLGKKSLVIHNGYDEDDFIELGETSVINKSEINFSYLGTMFGKQKDHKLIEGIALFNESYQIRRDYRFNLVGEFDNLIINKVITLDCVSLFEKLDHKSALNFMNTSSILILILPNDFEGSVAFSGKFFEYVKIGKPMLAVVPEGEVSRLVRKFNLGEVANPDDANDISIKISEIISKRKTYSRMPKNEIIKYSREYLTSLLNSTLNLYDEKD